MTRELFTDATALAESVNAALSADDLPGVAGLLADPPTDRVAAALERLDRRRRAVAYRLLAKDRAVEVFENLDPELQSELVGALRDGEVATLFAELDPDDRVWLLDELPAALATRLLRGLPERERQLTAEVLGYPQGSIGRRMSPEYITAHTDQTAALTMERVRAQLDSAETIYTLPVVDGQRRVVGVLSLRDLLRADPEARIDSLMQDAYTARAVDDAEVAARRCTEHGLLALPIVDDESRLVGVLTIDDAARVLEYEESEDSARQGGVEPLRRPYLSTPIRTLVRSRVVWLLVLAVGATLTVQVLSIFEETLSQVTVLALFVPLLIGTGGNTGNQAATTVTRALALNDVQPQDILRVIGRELRVGMCLGGLLGTIGFVIASLVYDVRIGTVIAATLLAICTLAATIGGLMPLVARALHVDPAVFSNPFISTFVDASGLIVYFLIAHAILQI